MESALAAQAQTIAAIRSHLTDEENEWAGDKLIWQRAVRFGPDTPEGHAKKLRAAHAAAEQYVAELLTAMQDEATQPKAEG